LQTYLKQYYEVDVHTSEEPFQKDFDLGIFDGMGLNHLRGQIDSHRSANSKLFLPILLITSRQDISVLTNNLWQTIDEIIFSPIEKLELIARVEMMLRARRYSVALEDLIATVKEGTALAERQRLAHELHDTVTQTLFLASTLAQTVPLTQKKNPQLAATQLDEVGQLNRSAMAQMRLLLLEIRPDNLLRTDLKELFEQLALATEGRDRIIMNVEVDEIGVLPETTHLTLYRITQEAVNNIVKHSHATAASITLHVRDGKLELHISDNGRGFNVEETANRLGLQGIRERADLLGAYVNIQSDAVQGGTDIAVTVPISEKLAAHSHSK